MSDHPATNICPKCKITIPPGSHVCDNCGAVLDSLPSQSVIGSEDAQASQKTISLSDSESSVVISTTSPSEIFQDQPATKQKNIAVVDASGSTASQVVTGGGTATQNIGTFIKEMKADTVIVQSPGGEYNEKNSIQANFVKKPASFRLISLSELNVIQKVFVRPSGYKDCLNKVLKDDLQRVVVIVGMDHSGRFACACHLASDLQSNQRVPLKVNRVTIDAKEGGDLYTILEQADFVNNGVYIIEDALGIDALLNSLANVRGIQEKLKDKNAYLLLTSSPEQALDQFEVARLMVSHSGEELKKIAQKHLEFYSAQDQWFSTIKNDLQAPINRLIDVHKIDSPVRIQALLTKVRNAEWGKLIQEYLEREKPGRTFENLDVAEKQQCIEQIFTLITDQSLLFPDRFNSNPREWFNKLNENQRLFIMLAHLFAGVESEFIFDLYTKAVNSLRKEEIRTLRDPRQIGTDDLLEATQAIINNDRIEINPIVIPEIERQINNRYHLLWSLMGLFREYIIALKGPDFWEIRRSFGMAIGRMAQNHLADLDTELINLAKHQSSGVAVVPGYALAQMCALGEENDDKVLELLNTWLGKDDRDLRWTAAATTWRIYSELVDRRDKAKTNTAAPTTRTINLLWDILEELASDIFEFNEASLKLAAGKTAIGTILDGLIGGLEIQDILSLDARQTEQKFLQQVMRDILISFEPLVFTINKMAEKDLIDVVTHLAAWIKSDAPIIKRVGLWCAQNLFFDLDIRRTRTVQPRLKALLNLVGFFLENEEELLVDVIENIRFWLECQGWDGKQKDIEEFFCHLINESNSRKLAALKTGLLQGWFIDPTALPANDFLGIKLLRRINLLLGVPVLLSNRDVIYLSVDDTENGRKQDYAFKARPLFERLCSRGETYANLMGTLEWIGSPEKGYQQTVHLPRPRPPLLIPGLENLLGTGMVPRLVVRYSFANALDDEDIEALNLSRNYLCLQKPSGLPGNKPSAIPSNAYLLLDDNDKLPAELFEKSLDQNLIQQILQLPAEKLAEKCSLVWPDFPFAEPDKLADALQISLCSTEIGLSTWDHDILYRLMVACMWVQKANPELLPALFVKWLSESDKTDIHKPYLIGISRLMLKVAVGDQGKNWQENQAPLISLLDHIHPLSNDLTTTQECIQYLLRFVSEVEDARFNNQQINQGDRHANFLKMVRSISPDEARDLIDWIKGLEKPETINKKYELFIKKLLVLLNTIRSREIPELKEGQKFGIILIQSPFDPPDDKQDDTNDLKPALEVYDLIQKNENLKNIVPMIFRTGQNIPVLSGEFISFYELREWILPESLPALTAPIVDQFDPEKIGFIVIITRGMLLDLDDWTEDCWEKGRVLLIQWPTIPGEDSRNAYIQYLSQQNVPAPVNLIQVLLSELKKE